MLRIVRQYRSSPVGLLALSASGPQQGIADRERLL
jgi:hypothetical protein